MGSIGREIPRHSGHREDPGWPAHVWLGLIPLWTRIALRGGRRARGLLALRMLYVSLASSPIWLLVLLFFLSSGDADRSGMPPAVAGAFIFAGLCATASIVIRGRRVPMDAARVVAAFRTVFFVRFALADAAAVGAFALFFLAGARLWVFGIGLVFSLIAFLFLAPTKRAIDEWDRPRRGREPRPPLGALLTVEE